MFAGLFAGLAAAFGGIGSSIINSSSAASTNRQQFEYQKQLMALQNKYNKENWEHQFSAVNDYNNPSNELARLESAGINPLFDSQYGGNSSASVGTEVGLPNYSPSVPQVDLQRGLSELVQAFFADKQIKLDERRVKALEDKTGADIKNNTDATLSQIEVNIQEIKESVARIHSLDAGTEKAKVETEKVKTDITATQESIKQRWQEIMQNANRVMQGWAHLGIEKFNSDWQKDIAQKNNALGWYDARTRRDELGLAKSKFDFEQKKFKKEYDLNFKRLSADIRKGKMDQFNKFLEASSSSILGYKWTSYRKLSHLTAGISAFVNNMDNIHQDDFLKIAPNVVSAMQKFGFLAEPPKTSNAYRVNPQFGFDQYSGHQDVHDGW